MHRISLEIYSKLGWMNASGEAKRRLKDALDVLYLCYYLSTIFFFTMWSFAYKRHKSFAFRFYIPSQISPLSSRSGSQLPDFQLLPCISHKYFQHSQYKTRWWSSPQNLSLPGLLVTWTSQALWAQSVCGSDSSHSLAPTSNPPWCLWIL